VSWPGSSDRLGSTWVLDDQGIVDGGGEHRGDVDEYDDTVSQRKRVQTTESALDGGRLDVVEWTFAEKG
jgi:hypothetical protein